MININRYNGLMPVTYLVPDQKKKAALKEHIQMYIRENSLAVKP